MRKISNNRKEEQGEDRVPPNYSRKDRPAVKSWGSKEKLTPEEVWKNAAILLDTKKKGGVQKQSEKQKRFDFSDIHAKMDEITKERVRTQEGDDVKNATKVFYENETANSIMHVTNFKELERKYTPRTPTETPPFFPKEPLYIFENQDTFKKLDTDTLFFVFYSQFGTIQQYYAATQLKLYSWRFHTKYFTWFQRLDEPKLITADYERGDFLFFDYDVTWSFMKKDDFTFEYKYLECSEW